MIISEKHKYIYLACPKTGTVSVERFLMEQDPTASRNEIVIDGHLIKFAGHSKVKDIKEKLNNNFKHYQVIGFVRHPYSRIVSSYFFYKKGGKTPSINPRKRGLIHNLRYMSARILPFKIWALVYPYKPNKEFFLDNKNEIIVQHIGLFENLNRDLVQIFRKLYLDFDVSKLRKMNKSKHEAVNTYFKNKFFARLINIKVREDLNFYKSLEQRK